METNGLSRRPLDYRDLDALLADVDHLRQSGYHKLKQWDLSQMLDHIGGGMKAAMRGSKRKAPWIVRMIAPFILRRVLRTRRMPEGIKAPKFALPGSGKDEAQAVEDFHRVAEEFREFSGPAQPHPVFGPMDYQTWTDLTLVHAAHHLSFLVPKS